MKGQFPHVTTLFFFSNLSIQTTGCTEIGV